MSFEEDFQTKCVFFSFNFCTSCHMNIISKECVKCPKGKPYHRLCLLQRNIYQHVNEGSYHLCLQTV